MSLSDAQHFVREFEFSIEYRIVYLAKKTHFIPSKLVNFPKIPQLFCLTLNGIRLLDSLISNGVS